MMKELFCVNDYATVLVYSSFFKHLTLYALQKLLLWESCAQSKNIM